MAQTVRLSAYLARGRSYALPPAGLLPSAPHTPPCKADNASSIWRCFIKRSVSLSFVPDVPMLFSTQRARKVSMVISSHSSRDLAIVCVHLAIVCVSVDLARGCVDLVVLIRIQHHKASPPHINATSHAKFQLTALFSKIFLLTSVLTVQLLTAVVTSWSPAVSGSMAITPVRQSRIPRSICTTAPVSRPRPFLRPEIRSILCGSPSLSRMLRIMKTY